MNLNGLPKRQKLKEKQTGNWPLIIEEEKKQWKTHLKCMLQMFGCIEAKNVEAKDATNPFFNFISANILFPLSMARWLNCDTFLNGCDCRNQIQKYLTNCHKITQKRPA